MHKIKYKSLAKADIREIVAWYETQRENLGREFRYELEQKIQLLAKSPKRQIIYGNIRRITLKRFSAYSVFYILNEQKQEIQILAVMHNSRNPETWRGRVKN